MEITLDTNNLTDTDRAVLQLLLGGDAPAPAPAKAAALAKTTAETKEAVYKIAEAAKAQAAKDKAAAEAKAKAAAEAKAKEAARIEAEEEAAAAALEATEGVVLEDEGPSLDDAVTAATKHVAAGNSAKVKTALEAAGAKRVRDLKGEQIAAFIQALEV